MIALLLSIVILIIAIGSLYCWVVEIIAAFKKEESPLMGILSIVLCSLGGFIIGWIHAKKWGISSNMKLWTLLIIVGIILNVISTIVLGAQMKMVPE